MEEKDKPRVSFKSNNENKKFSSAIKLDTKNSSIAKQVEKKQLFEEKVKEVSIKMENDTNEAYLLGKRFLEIMSDKTLLVNKGPLEKSIEKEVLNNLIQFAIKINNDVYNENQEVVKSEGMGNITINTLLLSSILKLRDRFNTLEYEIEQLKKQMLSSQSTPNAK